MSKLSEGVTALAGVIIEGQYAAKLGVLDAQLAQAKGELKRLKNERFQHAVKEAQAMLLGTIARCRKADNEFRAAVKDLRYKRADASSEADEKGPKAAAPNQGASKKPNRAVLSWQKALHLHLSKHKRYPGEARSRRVQGVVTVAFTIDRAGKVSNTRVLKGSGSSLLDEEALEMLSRASPLPLPPEDAPDGLSNLSIPVQFNIR